MLKLKEIIRKLVPGKPVGKAEAEPVRKGPIYERPVEPKPPLEKE